MHIRTTLPPCKTARRAGSAPRARTRSPAPAAATFAASLSVGALSTALAGPTGGVVVEGQGSISNPSISATVIDQASQRLTLNWSTFNVGANESVQFNQPSSTALALNRILDQNPSQIFGSLRANGQVVLVNPNGLLIGRSAQLNVNSLVASSLDAIDFDAVSGRYRFSTSRSDVGAVVNEGSITAGPGGSVTLLGGRVSNSGTIVADFGTVNLAAGRAATLDLAGDGLLRLEVNSDLLANGGGTSAVENNGTIQANGGQVLLTASAVKDVFANLINNTGVVRANRIDNTGGTIRLLGPDGIVQSGGTLDASAGDATSTGGSISVLGDRVGLVGNAVVDVSGATGGGTALIGGDYQGSNPDVLNATRTYVGSGVTLNADAGANGDGGRLIVWANEDTHYYGQLTARGGTQSGNGGFAEVSGKQNLDFTGASDLTAPHGSWGTLLLDPDSISIEQGAPSVPAGRFTDQDWTAAEDSGSGVVPIDPQQIENLLDANVLALHASQDITSDANADINVSGDAGASGNSLTLAAGGAMNLQGDIRLNNGALILTTGTGDLTVSGVVDTNGGAATFSTGAAGKITLSNTLTTNDGQIDLTAGTGGIDLQDGSALSAGNAAINLTSDGTVRLTALSATGPGVITIGATGAVTDDGDNTTRVVAPRAVITAGASIGTGGTTVDTNVTTLAATASTGSIHITEQDSITLEDVRALNAGTTGTVNVTSGGDLTVEDVRAFQNVNLTSSGAILGTGPATGIISQAGKITLHATDNIGTVGGGATPVRIAQANSLSALSDDATNGAINIQLPAATAVNVATGDIRLGSNPAATGRSGTVLLQSSGALDASGFATGAINIGGSNAVTVNLTATNGLVLPAGVNFTDQPAATLFLEGSNITDTGDADANTLSLSAVNLNFRALTSPADKTLNTDVDKLDATLGGNHNLTVAEQSGPLTLGSISAGAGDVTINSPGGLFDDNSATAVTGGLVTLSGPSLGVLNNELDTIANSLSLNATNGSAYVREAASGGAVTLVAGHALDVFDLATGDGAITVNAAVTSGNGVSIVTNAPTATARNLQINNTINGGAGPVTLTAGPAGSSLSFDSAISGGSVTMTAGTVGSPGAITAIGAPTISAGGALSMTGATIGLGNRILTDVGSLTTRSLAGGTFVTEANGVSVDAIATGGPLDILASGAMTVNQARGAGVTLTTNGAGSHITIGGVVNGGSGAVSLVTNGAANIVINDTVDATGAVTLTAGPTGNIAVNDDVTSTSSGITLTAGTAGNWGTITSAAGAESSGGSVTAHGASIGTSTAARFNTSTNTLNLTSEGGNIFAQELGATTLNASALGGGALDVATSDGLLNVTAASGTGVTLETNGPNRALLVNGTINGNGAAVVLSATGAVSGAGQILGSSLDATATSIGSSGPRLATTVGSLTTNSTGAGGTFITESDGATLNGTATAGGTLDVRTTGGALDVSAASGNGVTLDAGGVGGVLTLNGAVAGNGSAVNLTASGDNGVVNLNSTVSTGAGAVTVTAGSVAARGALNLGAGNHITGGAVNVTALSIGSSGQRLNTDATSLTATSTAAGGNVWVQEDNALNALTASAAGVVDVAAGGNMGVTSATGSGVTLSTTGGGNIAIVGAVAGGATGVTLTAGGAVTSGGGTVTGNSLTATGTAIGASGARLATNVNTLNTTSTGAGGTFITEADGATLTGSAVGGGALDVLVTAGSLTENAAAGNGVTLVAGGAGNTLTLNGAVVGGAGPVTLSASGAGGNIDLKNTVSTTGTVSITAGTGGARGLLTVDPASSIAGGAVTVAAQSIGTSGTRLKTAATSLDATSSNGDIYVDQTGALTTLTANATGVVDVIGNSALGSGGGSVTGTSFTATGTSIGSSGSRLATNVATLNLSSTGAGGMFITEADGVTLTGSATGGGGLDVQTTAGTLNAASINGNGIRLVAGGAGSNLNVSSAVAGGSGDVTLAATGNNGNVDIGGSVNTTGDVTITAGSVADRGVITLGGGGGTVSGDDVVVAAESIGTSGGPLVTTARTLNATSSNGGVFVRDTDGLDLTANATGGTVSVETLSGALRVLGAAGDGVTLTTAGAGNGITVDGAVDGRAANVTLNAQGDGAAIVVNSTVTTSADVQLTAGSSSARGAITAGAGNQVNASGLVAVGASIGAVGSRLNTAVTAMDLTSTNGGTFVTEANGLTLTANATGGAVDVQTTNGVLNVNGVTGNGVTLSVGGAANDLNINGAVGGGAGEVALSAAGAGGAIHLDAPVSTTGNVTLTAGTAGNRGAIVAGAGEQITGNALTATGASLGAGGARLATTVSSLNATTSNGGIFVTESDALALTANATGGAVDVTTTNGALTVAAASGNGVSLVTNGNANDLSVTGPVSGGASDVTLLANGAGSNLRLSGAISTTANVALTAGTSASRGAIITDAGNGVAANTLTAVGTGIGTSGFALNTTVNSVDATATGGNIRILETNDLAITAHATGGSVEARTLGSAIDVAAITAEGVTLEAAGNGPLNVNGPISAGGGAVSLVSGGAITLNGTVTTTGSMGLNSGAGADIVLNAALSGGNVDINAGTLANAGDLVVGTNAHVTADRLRIRSVSVGASNARLGTSANSLDATASNGGIFIDETDALDLAALASGTLDVRTLNGALNVSGASGGSLVLLSSSGAITGGPNNNITGGSVNLAGASIGASNARINTDVATLNATSTNGGVFLHEANDVALNASATGGAVDVSAGGTITVAAANGNGVTLATTTPGGAITVNNAINGGGGPVALTAGGAGSGITLNAGLTTTGTVTLTAGTTTNRGAITVVNGVGINGASLTAAGSSIGSAANRLRTTVASLDATSTNGGTFVTETDGLTLNANATGGALDVQTTSGALTVTGAAGSTVTLTAGGAGSGIAVNGAINAGAGDVALTAGTTASRGAITGTAGGRVSGGTLTALASSVGTTAAPLNTTIDALNANAGTGDIAISEQNGLRLTDVRAGGSVSVTSASGDIAVNLVNATNNAALTASGGAIVDDGDDTTRLVARDVTLVARSIGGASTVTGTTLDSKPRLDISATTLEATSTAGGVFIDELDGLTRVSAHASGGAAGDIELLSATGDLNLQSIGASDSLLLAAGRDIMGLPGLGVISARAAELRAGGADSTAGHIGSLNQPLNLQLAAGNTLRLFVPQAVDPNDATRAPATLPSQGVVTTLSLFGAPNALSVQAGFGQFTGLGDTQFTSPAESLVRTIQNQTAVTQSVVGLDWASFDPNVSLFGTLDPAVCLPSDQRDEEKGDAGC